MVESTCFQHTSSHPDSTIILWTELFPKKRREKIQGEILQSIFEYSVSTHNPSILQELQELQCFHTQSSNSKFPQLILHTELILPQEISKKYYNYKAHPVHTDRRHPPVIVPHASKHSTQQNKAPSFPTAFQAHTAQAGFQLILPSRNSTLSSSQHPCSPYSSSQANFIGIHLVLQNSTRRNRIHFKRVKYCISMQY